MYNLFELFFLLMNFNFKILSDNIKKEDIKKNEKIFLLRSSIIDKRVRV